MGPTFGKDSSRAVEAPPAPGASLPSPRGWSRRVQLAVAGALAGLIVLAGSLFVGVQSEAIDLGEPWRGPPGRGAGAASAGGVGDPKPANASREAGLYYFVLAEYTPREARRLVAFLASNGIDAKAVPQKNGGFHRVVALRGFERPNSDAAERRRTLLSWLGRRWHDLRDGPSTLASMHLEQYRPGETGTK